MNRENIQKVRDVIAGLPAKRFDMRFSAAALGDSGDDVQAQTLAHSCNTAGCIAGWTVASMATCEGPNGVLPQAARLLGLNAILADELFTPVGYYDTARYPKAHAIRVLDHLLATGEVDWKGTRRAKKADTSERQGKVPGMDQSGASS